MFALSHVVETRAFVGVDSVTAVADGTIAEEKSAAINESKVIFLILTMIIVHYCIYLTNVTSPFNSKGVGLVLPQVPLI